MGAEPLSARPSTASLSETRSFRSVTGDTKGELAAARERRTKLINESRAREVARLAIL